MLSPGLRPLCFECWVGGVDLSPESRGANAAAEDDAEQESMSQQDSCPQAHHMRPALWRASGRVCCSTAWKSRAACRVAPA